MIGIYICYILLILYIIKKVHSKVEGYAGCPTKHNLKLRNIYRENYKRELETMSISSLKRLVIETGVPKELYYATEKTKKALMSLIYNHRYKEDYTPSNDFLKESDIPKKKSGSTTEPTKKKRIVQNYMDADVYYADPYDLETTNEKKRKDEAGGGSQMGGAGFLEGGEDEETEEEREAREREQEADERSANIRVGLSETGGF